MVRLLPGESDYALLEQPVADAIPLPPGFEAPEATQVRGRGVVCVLANGVKKLGYQCDLILIYDSQPHLIIHRVNQLLIEQANMLEYGFPIHSQTVDDGTENQ